MRFLNYWQWQAYQIVCQQQERTNYTVLFTFTATAIIQGVWSFLREFCMFICMRAIHTACRMTLLYACMCQGSHSMRTSMAVLQRQSNDCGCSLSVPSSRSMTPPHGQSSALCG